ncbi:MAG: insulinase family protein [Alphaproteobacteria bacterium]|nr:insulinase family protein [Alphaproteobacteria bacterium]
MHRRILVSLLAALVCGFVLASPGRAGVFNPQTFTLENGLQVVVITNRRAPVVTHMIYYKVGAIDEPVGKSGVAHFLEHLMFKGTKTLKPGEFSTIIARNGGKENAFTSQDFTGYFQSVAADRLETMMRHEADRMTNLVLNDAEFEAERNVVLEERRSRVENNPSSKLREQANAALYMNHPYRIPTIGWEHEIRAISREDAMDFYRAWYAPNNAILVLSGDITAEQARPLVERHYGKIGARPLPPRRKLAEPPQSAERQVTLRHRQVRQPSWSRRYIAPSYSQGPRDQVYALQVLSQILSGGPTSRLYRSIAVEQGVAASVGAWYNPDTRGPGAMGFYGSPRPGHDVAAIEAAVKREIARLLKDGVTETEVAEAIQRLQDAAIFARDSIRKPARILGSALAIGMTIEDVEKWPERIGAVTAESVNAAARAILSQRGVVTAILLPDEST